MGSLKYDLAANRVFCVDPNDSHGVVNGMPLTPDYTDYCIWCNLIVERVSRFKNQVNGTDITSSYYISYGLNSSGENEYVSFMSGADPEHGYNFLTTDYSDIDFNTVKKRNTIEGLQIESIRISLQNFNCPMVVIKFTDLRGSGFFGREEATHNEYGRLNGLETDKNGEPIENIFGSFATIPYPRFRLQIKGFYGTPVTYQLTCSGFDGSFNSSTGNFDITVKFIGYEYGILGDIPFSYVVAAPLTPTGEDYWEKHSGTDAWALPMGNNTDKVASDKPIHLIDFYNNIDSSLSRYESEELDINDVVLDNIYTDFITSYTERDESMREIKLSLLKLRKRITDEFGAENIVDVNNTDTDVIVIFSKSEQLTCSKELLDLRNEYADNVYRYVSRYQDSEDMFDATIIPGSDENGRWEDWTSTTAICSEYMNFQYSGDTVIHPNSVVESASKDGRRTPISETVSCYGSNITCFNETRNLTVNQSLSRALYEAFGIKGGPYKQWAFEGSTAYKKYAVAFDFKNATQKISDSLTYLEIKYKKYQDIVKANDNNTISKIVGFAPYVSNYFKTVMCHIETLVYLFNNTADKIYGQILEDKRKPSLLGVNNLQLETDIPGQTFKQIPPFPAVYKTRETEFETDTRIRTGENIVQTTWIGDFNGDTKWAEEELVDEIVQGLKVVWDNEKNSSAKNKKKKDDMLIPNKMFIPFDFISDNPSHYISNLTASSNASGPESLAYYAASRMELLFGVFDQSETSDNSLYEAIGAMDGYRILSSGCNINHLFEGLEDGESMVDELINMSICQNHGNNGSERNEFEFADTLGSRHPIFSNAREQEYKYITTDNGSPVIPTNNFNEFKDLPSMYTYNNGKWRVNKLESNSYVFGENGNVFITGQKMPIGTYVIGDEIPEHTIGTVTNSVGSFIDDGEVTPITIENAMTVTVGTEHVPVGMVETTGVMAPIGTADVNDIIGGQLLTPSHTVPIGTDTILGTTPITVGTPRTNGVILRIGTTSQFVGDIESIAEDYTNKSMFTVITDQNEYKNIIGKITPLSSNTTYIGGYSSQLLDKIRDRYILSHDNCDLYKLSNYRNMRNGYSELGIKPTELVNQDGEISSELMAASESQTGLFIQAFTSAVDSQCAVNN